MKKEKTLQQIEKLLALSTSANENEAKLAMDRAKALLEKLNLQEFPDFTKHQEAIEERPITYKITATGGLEFFPYIANTVAKFFGSAVLVGKDNICLVGFPTTNDIVEYHIDSIMNQGMADYRKEYRIYRTLAFATGFWQGFESSLRRKFKKEQPKEEKAIVLYDAVAEYMKKFSKCTASNFHEAFGYASGLTSGANAELMSGISEGNKGKLLK